MKRFLLFLFTLFSMHAFGQGPALEMLIYPKYIEGGNDDYDAGRNGIPYVYRAKITGLKPGRTYRYENKLVIATTETIAAPKYIYILPPGNVIPGTPNYTTGDFFRPPLRNNGKTNGSSILGNLVSDYGTLTADAQGSYTGWFIQETVGGLYAPGGTRLIRISLNDPDAADVTAITYMLHSTDPVTVLTMDFIDNDASRPTYGTAIRSTAATSGIPKNFVFLYDNEAGTGRPVAGTFIEDDGVTGTLGEDDGNGYGAFYFNHVNGVNGAWGAMVLNTDANGIKRIEQRSLADGSLVGYNTSADGSWADGANPGSNVNTAGTSLGADRDGNIAIVIDGSKVTLGVTKTPQTVAFTNTFPATYKVGDPDFTLSASSSAGLSDFQYTVTPAGILEITGNTVKIIGGGTAKITVTEPGNTTIAAGSKDQTIKVDAIPQAITGLPVTLTSTYGNANLSLAATGGASGNAIVYTSADPLIAEITNGNEVSFKKSGTVTIKANQPGNANYEAAAEVTSTLTIARASLDVIAEDKVKTQGAANPAATFTYGAFKNTDDATAVTGVPVMTIAADASSPAGVYDITIDVSGLTSDKYTFNPVKGKLTVENKQVQTITFTGFPAAAVYGNEPLPFQVSSNTANEITMSSSNANVAVAEKNAIGEWTVKIIGAGEADITAAQAEDGTYTPGLTLQHISVSKAPLKIIADDKAKITGDADPVFTARYEGFVNNDDISKLNGTLQFTKQADGANFLIIPSGLTADNYELFFVSGKLTVGDIAFAPMNKTYGDAAFNPGATRDAGEIPVYTIANPAIAVVNANGLMEIKGAGTTEITATFASGYSGSATLKVAQKEVLVIPDAQTKTYMQPNPDLTVKYTGLVYGETEDVFTAKARLSTTAVLNSPAASYLITANGAAANNYSFRYQTGVLTVTKAILNFTYDDLPALTYGDAGFTPVTTADYNAQPVFSSDNTNVAIIDNGMVKIVGAGKANITASFATTGDYTGGTAVKSLIVNKRALIVRTDSKTRLYGQANPVLTGTYSGFVNGETIAAVSAPAVYATTATPLSPAGTYTISGAAASAQNYSFTYEPGILTVDKAVLTVTADNKTKVYGTQNPDFTFKYTGFVNAESASVLQNPALASTEATTTTPSGTYPIVPYGATDENYAFNYVNGVLTITSTSRTITLDPLPLKYVGDDDFTPAAVLSSGETPVFTSGDETIATIVNNKVHLVGPGTVLITASAPVNASYSVKPSFSQYMLVKKAEQTITFETVPALSTDGKTYTLKATASSGLPVTFTVSDPVFASLNGDVIKGLRIGKIQVVANQAGDSRYAAAKAVEQLVQIGDASGADLIIHPALSLNGDGRNEFLSIDGIKEFPYNKVTIVNRGGIKVFDIEGYDNDQHVFVGKSKSGAQLPQGTYFCLIEYYVNSKVKTKTGYFIIKY